MPSQSIPLDFEVSSDILDRLSITGSIHSVVLTADHLKLYQALPILSILSATAPLHYSQHVFFYSYGSAGTRPFTYAQCGSGSPDGTVTDSGGSYVAFYSGNQVYSGGGYQVAIQSALDAINELTCVRHGWFN